MRLAGSCSTNREGGKDQSTARGSKTRNFPHSLLGRYNQSGDPTRIRLQSGTLFQEWDGEWCHPHNKLGDAEKEPWCKDEELEDADEEMKEDLISERIPF